METSPVLEKVPWIPKFYQVQKFYFIKVITRSTDHVLPILGNVYCYNGKRFWNWIQINSPATDSCYFGGEGTVSQGVGQGPEQMKSWGTRTGLYGGWLTGSETISICFWQVLIAFWALKLYRRKLMSLWFAGLRLVWPARRSLGLRYRCAMMMLLGAKVQTATHRCFLTRLTPCPLPDGARLAWGILVFTRLKTRPFALNIGIQNPPPICSDKGAEAGLGTLRGQQRDSPIDTSLPQHLGQLMWCSLQQHGHKAMYPQLLHQRCLW